MGFCWRGDNAPTHGLAQASSPGSSPGTRRLTRLLAAVVLVAFFQHSDSATLTETTLKLNGVSPQTGWFTNRPYRGAGQTLTEEFISWWSQGDDSFTDDPPNADLDCTVNGDPPLEMVCDNPAHLFIDAQAAVVSTDS